ncbi:hypothetical protein [Ruegeria sp. HKCCD8929]|uniref:hypothetical protein n=1 Tax=Ruegeria sp. HKCCD8929 TaxID=2683006 RepID=UPI00148872D9|nr:hypothetical protein [Ruegeria sp. HKCCD8929]
MDPDPARHPGLWQAKSQGGFQFGYRGFLPWRAEFDGFARYRATFGFRLLYPISIAYHLSLILPAFRRKLRAIVGFP